MLSEAITLFLVGVVAAMFALGWAIGNHLAVRRLLELHDAAMVDKDAEIEELKGSVSRLSEARKQEIQFNIQRRGSLMSEAQLWKLRAYEIAAGYFAETGKHYIFPDTNTYLDPGDIGDPLYGGLKKKVDTTVYTSDIPSYVETKTHGSAKLVNRKEDDKDGESQKSNK